MSYTRRIQIALALSVLLHVAGLSTWYVTPRPVPVVPLPPPAPIELDLQPETPSPVEPVQLVDVAVPAAEPVAPSPLIAEENSEAMDETPLEGDVPSPQLTPDEFDQLAAAPAPPVEPAPRPEPRPSREAEDDDGERDDPEVPSTYEMMETQLEDIVNSEDVPPVVEKEPPLKLAQADPALPERPSPGRSRATKSVAKDGVTNFQAIQSEVAPYLKQVRAQVEREWNEMLYTRYSGTKPVKAVIDCAISPTGELVSVSVVGTDNDRLYSALCKDAVQRAGPFGPFPFIVPDIYRDKNLEIRWTFSFL